MKKMKKTTRLSKCCVCLGVHGPLHRGDRAAERRRLRGCDAPLRVSCVRKFFHHLQLPHAIEMAEDSCPARRKTMDEEMPRAFPETEF